jgi:homoserine kinase type II
MDVSLPAAAQAALVDAYEITPPVSMHRLRGGVNNVSYRVDSAGASFFLKRYETGIDQASLAYEHDLLRWLNTQPRSFAVPAPHLSRRGETLCSLDGALYSLFAWLPGERPLPTPRQAQAFGQALAELHHLLAAVPTTPRPGMASYGELAHVHPAVPHPELPEHTALLEADAVGSATLAWWRGEVLMLQSFAAGPYRDLPWQVVHGDVAFGNSLFQGELLVALLDFEFAGPDARAIDLASALWGLLKGEERAMVAMQARALLAGYQQVQTLRDDERAALPTLIRLRNAVHTIWWVGRRLTERPGQPILPVLVEARQCAELVTEVAATHPDWSH